MNGNGSVRSRQIFDLGRIDLFGVFIAEATGPLIVGIVLIEKFAIVASRDGTQWPLIIAHIIKINAYCERAVIGVWPVGNILMPVSIRYQSRIDVAAG